MRLIFYLSLIFWRPAVKRIFYPGPTPQLR